MRGKKTAAIRLSGLLCLCMLFLSGCSQTKEPEAITAPTILVSDKGIITQYLVGDFEKDYYNVDELGSMVMEEAAELNADRKGEEPAVEVLSVERPADDSGKVVVVIQYPDAESYRKYNEADFFYGTVAQAHEAGYDLDIEMTSVKDGTVIGESEIYDLGTRHILIAQTDSSIICPKKVLYISEGLKVKEDGSIDSSGTEGISYIITK